MNLDRADRERRLSENASALSGAVHASRRYRRFYDKHADTLSGFVGIWSEVAAVAVILTNMEDESEGSFYDFKEWPEVIDELAGKFFEKPTREESERRKAIEAIRR